MHGTRSVLFVLPSKDDMKPKIAVVRGKFLNTYEMQFFEPLTAQFDITAFGSLHPYHDAFAFPVKKLPSPMDLPDFPYKMPVLNRIFTDAHYLLGLEKNLQGFDIAHTAETYFHYTQQCLNAKKKGYVKKVIATVLENIPFNNEGIRGRKAFKKRAREELDHIIALTHKTKDALLEEGADAKKISVISHFVDTQKFTPAETKKDKKQVTVLFSGRLESYKGVHDIVHAALEVLKDPQLKEYRITFVMVGEGSQKSALIKSERELGVTQYFVHKHVSYDAMPGQYQKADIFLAPSKPTATWDEQYCTALLEAQASGLAIVTTRTGGIPENVGDAALLVSPGDTKSLAQAIKKFILDAALRKRFAQKARQRAVDVHDIQIGAKKLARLYLSLL